MSFVSKKMQGKTPYSPNIGSYEVRLDANESPFGPSFEVKEAFFGRLCAADLNRYPDPNCTTLRQSFATRYGVNADNVVAGNGSDELISVIMTSLLDSGDTLAVATPEFSMYAFYAELSENTVLYMPKSADYKLADLLQFVKEKGCRAVILSNPCNPTGQGFSRDEVLSFVKSCPALCIIDEAYMDFWDQSILDVAHEHENLLVLRTLSKAFGAAGIRLGFAVGHPTLIKALNVARSPYNVNTMTQLMGELLLERAEDRAPFLAAQAKRLESELRTLFPNATVFPTTANFVYLQVKGADRIDERLQAAGIIVRRFGDDRLRITASTDEEMARLLAVLNEIRKDLL